MENIEKYVDDVFEKNKRTELVYHNLDHTRKVVLHVREISQYYLLGETDLFIVECAAWFHDLGYLSVNEPSGHELRGAELGRLFLKRHHISDEILGKISDCILATTLPQMPQTLLEEILCDSDLYHFGTPDLFFRDALMHKEVELRIRHHIDERQWIEGTINLLNSHKFHTEYCLKKLSQRKSINITKFEMILREINTGI